MKKTVAIGLSGGVDSSVTTLILKEKYNIIALTMEISNEISNPLSKKGCYGGDKAEDFAAIKEFCSRFNIPHHFIDCKDAFQKFVLQYFKKTYLIGATPNPCIQCNTQVKFKALLEKARAKGIQFDLFATGHYAQIVLENGEYLLKKGIDFKKDQSYFLYRLPKELLPIIRFPLGKYTKEEVRDIAAQAGLETATKKDSQDFYVGNYSDLIEKEEKIGNICTLDGKIVGKHHGFWKYTVGQRKGLGVAYPVPLFVVDIEAETNTVYVGKKEDLLKESAVITDLNWLSTKRNCENLTAKTRSTAEPVPVLIKQFSDTEITVTFQNPQSVTTGQSLVLYDNDTVLGGGIIV